MDHWQGMEEFCRYERLAGGPDPHMAVVGHLSRDVSQEERLWRAWCYLSCYNVPTAEYLWTEWPWERVAGQRADGILQAWVESKWPLPLRRERKRLAMTAAKFTRGLLSYAEWSADLDLRGWLNGEHADPQVAYEVAWKDCQKVYSLGRYVALKYLEFLQRYCDAPIAMPDLRLKGGWSPKEGLALLYPEHAIRLNDGDMNVALAEQLGEAAREILAGKGVPLDRYNMQVLLCDYKQSAIGKRQYPGRSQDSEIEYAQKLFARTGFRTSMWDARAEIFPAWALGEIMGWQFVREDLGNVWADFGYTWSDSLYSWFGSKDHLDDPDRYERVLA